MHGNGALTDRQVGSAAGGLPPVEQLSSIHDNTINILRDASYSLDQLLAKMRGSQPNKDGGGMEKAPERHILGDSRVMRDLASGIIDRVNELQRIVGHEK